MYIVISEEKDIAVVRLCGRLDAKTSVEFEKKIQSDLVPLKKDVFLDCQGLDYVSSAGLSSLILFAKVLKSDERTLTLSNVQPMVSDILHITGLIGKVFTVQH